MNYNPLYMRFSNARVLTRSLILCAAVFLLMLLLVGCTKRKEGDAGAFELISHSFAMMGTQVEIKVATEGVQGDRAMAAILHARNDMKAFVDQISSWNPDSETSRINASAGVAPVSISPALMRVLLQAREISEISGGAFDVTFSPLGRQWRLDPDDPLIPEQEIIKQTLELVGYHDLQLDPDNPQIDSAGAAFLKKKGMRIDLGGIAKGSAIDVAAKSLRESGFENALINAGGDLYAMGTRPDWPWTVGVRNPRGDNQQALIGTISIRDAAVATSGDYEKTVVINGKRYHHILDPRTGYPAEGCISVSVIASDAETADALATAFFILGPDDGMALCEELEGVEALFIDPDFNQRASPGFPEINQ